MSVNEVDRIIIRGEVDLISTAVQEAVDCGQDPAMILNTMLATMDVVDQNFKNGSLLVPEVLIAAKTVNKGIEVLEPLLSSSAFKSLERRTGQRTKLL